MNNEKTHVTAENFLGIRIPKIFGKRAKILRVTALFLVVQIPPKP